MEKLDVEEEEEEDEIKDEDEEVNKELNIDWSGEKEEAERERFTVILVRYSWLSRKINLMRSIMVKSPLVNARAPSDPETKGERRRKGERADNRTVRTDQRETWKVRSIMIRLPLVWTLLTHEMSFSLQ